MDINQCRDGLYTHEVLIADTASLGVWQREAEALRRRFDRHVDDLRRLSMPGALPRMAFGIINHPELNGVATLCRDGESVLVAIYLGSLIQMIDTFYRLLSHPQVLPQVGNCPAGPGEPIPFLMVGEHVTRGRGIPHLYIPEDPDRRAFADRCVRDALDFLLVHELAHGWRGHLVLGENDAGWAPRREFDSPDSREAENLEWQALECDADMMAATLIQAHVRAEAREALDATPSRVSAWAFALVIALHGLSHWSSPSR
jgi:hypothetical protein